MIVIYSQSESFRQYIDQVVKVKVSHRLNLTLLAKDKESNTYLIHSNSYTLPVLSDFIKEHQGVINKVGIIDDLPDVHNMLTYTQLGVQAYCNTYMAAPHYQQLLALLKSGQSWYPPPLLAKALALAHQSVNVASNDERLQLLTPREKQVALSVAEGKSNKLVAREYAISERTVKAHLTHIFEKLHLKDRMALIIYLKQQGFAQTGT